eukprot:jgi/Botrbrau1/13803/Bobra.0056s0051.1
MFCYTREPGQDILLHPSVSCNGVQYVARPSAALTKCRQGTASTYTVTSPLRANNRICFNFYCKCHGRVAPTSCVMSLATSLEPFRPSLSGQGPGPARALGACPPKRLSGPGESATGGPCSCPGPAPAEQSCIDSLTRQRWQTSLEQ